MYFLWDDGVLEWVEGVERRGMWALIKEQREFDRASREDSSLDLVMCSDFSGPCTSMVTLTRVDFEIQEWVIPFEDLKEVVDVQTERRFLVCGIRMFFYVALSGRPKETGIKRWSPFGFNAEPQVGAMIFERYRVIQQYKKPDKDPSRPPPEFDWILVDQTLHIGSRRYG